MTTFTPLQSGIASRSIKSDTFFSLLVGVLVFVFSVISLVYLSHANAVATKGYQMKQLQEERTQLRAEVNTWNLKLTRLQALNALDFDPKVSKMAKFSEFPQFIQKDTQVALKR